MVICVYKPFYQRGNGKQTDLFVETVDALQGVIDNHCSSTPVKIIGDFHVQLPKSLNLSPGWSKRPGFNAHCSIFYDFMCANEFIIADFMFEQSLNYTYFCNTTGNMSWLDHCISTSHDTDNILSCTILPLDENNLSDHLPVQISFSVSCADMKNKRQSNMSHQQFPPAKWDNHARNDKYRECLAINLMNIDPVSTDGDTQHNIDMYIDNMNHATHAASREAGCTQQRKYKPKPFWCPNLAQLRDKKHFWWRVWDDNNRPDTDSVYQYYKNVKKLFRKTYRQSVDKATSKHYNNLQNMSVSRNMRAFWNEIKQQKRSKVVSRLKPDDFKRYYSSITQENPDVNTARIDQTISDQVDAYYREHIRS